MTRTLFLWRRAHRLIAWLGLLAVSLVVLSCRPARRPQPVVEQPSAAEEVLALAAHLPTDDTLGVVATPNFGALIELLGALASEDEMATRREELALGLTERIGADLTRRQGWEHIGVDTTAPALLGLVTTPEIYGLVAFRLRDAAKLRRALYRWRDGLDLSRQPVVRGGVLVMKGRGGALALFERSAVLALGPEAEQLIERVAQLRPEASLAQRLDFKRRVRGVEGGGELWLYAPPRAMVYWSAGLDARWAGTDLKGTAEQVELMHRRMLGVARAQGATTAEQARIDARYRDALAGLRDDPRGALLRKFFGDLPGAVFTVRLSGEQPRAAGRLFLTDKAPLAGLLRGQAPPPWGQPIGDGVHISGQLDPGTLRELMGAFGGRVAEQWQEAGPELQQALRASLDGRMLMVSRRGQLAVRLGLSDKQAGPRLLDALRKSAWALDGAAGEAQPLRIKLGRLEPSVRLEQDSVVLQSGQLAAPAWPASGVSQFSMQLALAEWMLPVGELDVMSAMPRNQLPERDPAVPVSEPYRAGLVKLKQLRVQLDETNARYRASVRRQRHKVGALKLSVRQLDEHIDVAIALQGGEGLRVLLGIWSEQESGGMLEVMQQLDEMELQVLELRRIYREEVEAHEATTQGGDATGDKPGAAAGDKPDAAGKKAPSPQ